MDKGRDAAAYMLTRASPGDLGQLAHTVQKHRKRKHVLAMDGGGTEHQCGRGAAENT